MNRVTPLFKMVFDNLGPLVEGGDERVGTLFLWHFVEEIEHRNSALLFHTSRARARARARAREGQGDSSHLRYRSAVNCPGSF